MDEYVYGELKLPLFRAIGCRIAYPLMMIRVPCASWLYFRCLLGAGVDFEVKSVDCGKGR
jgi:hypothetical protein